MKVSREEWEAQVDDYAARNPNIYTAYYSDCYGDMWPATLTTSRDIAEKVSCSVVKSEDYMRLLNKYLAIENKLKNLLESSK